MCCVVPRVSASAHTTSVVQANVTVGLNVGVEGGVTREGGRVAERSALCSLLSRTLG